MEPKQVAHRRSRNVSFQGPASMLGARKLELAGHQEADSGEQQAQEPTRSLEAGAKQDDKLTVCDITGDWGLYQWSLCLFATIYSALAGICVVFGPILTPDLAFSCNATSSQSIGAPLNSSQASSWPSECFKMTRQEEFGQQFVAQECESFLFDDGQQQQQLGLTLTNSFNLVCGRQWLRSLVSSASLAGMLVSSVTLGLFSDKFGRLRCIQLAFAIALPANAYAMVTENYFLFCACIMLMSYSQVGAANALCTLLMEATSPRLRFVPVFEYGIGWGLGGLLVPLLNKLTLDYRWLMGVLLVWQVAMLPWLHWGIFESIRWLLSEGHFNRAQIELRRACRMNRVRQDGTRLAQDIASIQVQQVRKASRVIELESAPRHVARALGTRVDETARELDMLSSAIRKCFFGNDDENEPEQAEGKRQVAAQSERKNSGTNKAASDGANSTGLEPGGQMLSATSLEEEDNCVALQMPSVLSPTLARMSFSVSCSQLEQEASAAAAAAAATKREPRGLASSADELLAPPKLSSQLESILGQSERRDSFTTQGLIKLALKYNKIVQQSDAGRFFVLQMFHRKLWRSSLILLCISLIYETAYYGLVQANKFVGQSVALNYVTGALGEWAAAFMSMLMLAFCSRKFSLISTTLIGSLVCFSMALSYHLIPAKHGHSNDLHSLSLEEANNGTANFVTSFEFLSQLGWLNSTSKLHNETSSSSSVSLDEQHEKLAELRDRVNFYLMSLGKFAISVGIQVAATIALEVYPNNLRQSGSGAILFVGRIGSIAAPFLFNDTSETKSTLKLTLLVMSLGGLLVSLFVPACIKDQKDKELCDQMDEIGQESEEKLPEK